MFHAPILPQNGGVERVTDIIGNELASRGHGIYYLATQPDGKMVYDDGRQFAIDCGPDMDRAEKEYLRLLADKQIDAVINQRATSESMHLLSLTPSGIKKFSVCHIQPFPYLGKERIIKKNTYPTDIGRKIFRALSIMMPCIFRWRSVRSARREFNEMARVSDKVVLLSDKFYRRVLDNVPGFPAEKLAAVNNPNAFAVKDGLNPTPKEKLIIFVGRLEEPQKNVRGFINVWNQFSKTHPDWKAEIIGDGSERQACEQYARSNQVERLSFVGKQGDVVSYYNRASFICLSSHYEGWGMVLIEGMAYGCIPVCYDSYESCHDIITDGVNGIISTPFSAKDMSDRMSEVVADGETMRVMAENARKKVKDFDVKVVVDQWEALLNRGN